MACARGFSSELFFFESLVSSDACVSAMNDFATLCFHPFLEKWNEFLNFILKPNPHSTLNITFKIQDIKRPIINSVDPEFLVHLCY